MIDFIETDFTCPLCQICVYIASSFKLIEHVQLEQHPLLHGNEMFYFLALHTGYASLQFN